MENRPCDIELADGIDKLFRYRIFPERNLVVVKLLQTVTAKDIARWESAMMQAPLFSPDMDGVIDQREAAADLNPSGVKEIAELNKRQHKVRGRWIHLVDEPMSTAMAVQYKLETAGLQHIEAFSTLEAASKYLGYDVASYMATLKDEISVHR